jgi:tetratricopeptide (TPR) repeat protein
MPRMEDAGWQNRVDALWDAFDDDAEPELLAAMERLVAERPADDPVALFEHASAYDATDQPGPAVALYRRALEHGLAGGKRREATIQLASSLRNVGRAEEGVALLEAELAAVSDDLDDAVRAFLALALVSAGREREAVGVALRALAPHLTRYTRSVAAYARELEVS